MEERNKEVFVDSNFFIALLNSEDSLNKEAKHISRELATQEVSYAISNLAFAEIVTVTSMRAGRQTAIEGGKKLLKSSRVRMIHVDEILHNETWKVFQQTNEKNVSFVDCSIITTMKAEGISKLLTFDKKDFKQLQKNYRFSLYE